MKKYLAVFCLFLWGCGEAPKIPPRYAQTRVITVEITIKDGDSYAACIDRGGIWVRGDSGQYLSEIAGCIEPEKK